MQFRKVIPLSDKLDPDDYPNIIERLRKDETTKDKTDKQIFEESNISVSWFVNDNFNVKNGFVSLTLNACYPSNDLNMIDVRSVEVVFDRSRFVARRKDAPGDG